MKFYLAGGAVRDLLLGRPVADRDYLVTDATKDEFSTSFPSAQLVGKAFPVFIHDRIEFSFPRAATLLDEIKSRDLTVNAQLLDENGNLICHPNGLEDLHLKQLRPASPDSFYDDPLRVFRAARFWAKFPDFTPHAELVELMKSVAQKKLLATLSADRVGQETSKALNSVSPGNYLRLLAQTDCLEPWFSEFNNCLNIPAGPLPYHDTNCLEHTCRVMDALAGNEISVWMGLCHDLGKSITLEDEYPHHYGHDMAGQRLAEELARRIRLSNKHVIAGSKASRWHMTASRYDDLRPGTKVDFLMDIHLAEVMDNMLSLVVADSDIDLQRCVKNDLNAILRVKLDKREMNRGTESGKRLRQLRAQKITSSRKK